MWPNGLDAFVGRADYTLKYVFRSCREATCSYGILQLSDGSTAGNASSSGKDRISSLNSQPKGETKEHGDTEDRSGNRSENQNEDGTRGGNIMICGYGLMRVRQESHAPFELNEVEARKRVTMLSLNPMPTGQCNVADLHTTRAHTT